MEKQKETKINKNGVYETIETIETTPNDGIVPEKIIRPVDMDTVGKYHKGYSTTKTFSTNDPRITRPFVYGTCSLILILGIVMLLTGNLFFGIVFVVSGILVFNKAKKDIDKIADEFKSKGQDVTIDSVEEKEQLKNEVIDDFKNSLKETTKKTFTRDKFKWFVKTTIPIYCGIAIVISFLLGFLINIFLGIFVFIILAIGGLLYYFILSKICKH